MEALSVTIILAVVVARIACDPLFVDLVMSVAKKIGLAPAYKPIETPEDDPVVGLRGSVADVFEFDTDRGKYTGRILVNGSAWNAEWGEARA